MGQVTVTAAECDACSHTEILADESVPAGWLSLIRPDGRMHLYCSWKCLADIATTHAQAR